RESVDASAAAARPRKARAVRPAPAAVVANGNEAAADPRAPPRIMTAAESLDARPRGEDQMKLPLALERRTEKEKEKKAAKAAPIAAPAADAAAVPAEAFPSLSLLAMPAQQEDLITASDLTRWANRLGAKLGDFGIVGRVTEIHPGPVVTTFEFEPAAGVKVNQIVSREDDLALALKAQRIRILAPIP